MKNNCPSLNTYVEIRYREFIHMRNIFRNAGFEVFTAVLLNILVTDVSKGLNAFIFRLKESKIKFVTVWYVK